MRETVMADDPRAVLARARALQQKGDLQAAEAAARLLVERAESDRVRAEAAAALAGILLLAGRPDEVPALLATAAREEPEGWPWLSDLGLARCLTGDAAAARSLLERAVAEAGADAVAFNRLGVARRSLGDLEGAAQAFAEAIVRDPNRAEWHSNLAYILSEQERLEDALVHYERALALDPDMVQASDGRTAVLLTLDRSGEAIKRLEDAAAREPKSSGARRKLARAFALADRYQEAEDSFAAARERASGDAEAADIGLELVRLLLRQDRNAAAFRAVEEILGKSPDNSAALLMKAEALTETRAFPEAEEALRKAAAVQHPDAPGVLLGEAALASAREDYDKAESILRRAAGLYPGAPAVFGQLGHVLLWRGRLDEAVQSFERAAALNPAALAALVEARKFPEDEATVARMEKFAGNPLVPSEARAAMEFALADVREARKDFDSAFAHADQANALVRRTIRYDPETFSRQADAVIRVFDPRLLARCRGMGVASGRPVFVVGMPRSGTTLTEQVLASHPDAFGAGEMPVIPAIARLMPKVLKTRRPYPFCMARFSTRTAEHGAIYYLKKIHALNATAARVADKLPHNFVHLGLISVLFPNAKIVHVARDARDVAVSNYFQNFRAKRGGMGYAFDLGHIGRQIRDHDRIMDHWRHTLLVPIFNLRYEDLVSDFERTARDLLHFVGLPWSDKVAEFHKTERAVRTASVWQVRQPLYASSKERWRRYAAHLGPLEEGLAGR